ncbi:MAG: ATP-binding cassette domain-containing protein [Oscillospiraceae bacterium]|nr:ATP-binding cassette domain-containing protein [Oscillospiraceae bacterium]
MKKSGDFMEKIEKNTIQAIKTKSLTKKYKDFTALNNVSITVDKGDVYGLIGKNGAGKTTLFKVIMGLTKKTSGDMIINNNNNLNEARSKIGFMIGLSFFPYLNAYQNIEYYRKMKGIKDKKETERVLKLVNLYEVKKPFKSFSMGMKQRLGIANALLRQPTDCCFRRASKSGWIHRELMILEE